MKFASPVPSKLQSLRRRVEQRSTPHAQLCQSPISTKHTATSTRRFDSETTLEYLQLACRIFSAVVDGTNIPVVKGVITAAAELITIAQTVKSNRTECQSLAKQLANCLLVLEQCTDCSEDDMTDRSQEAFAELQQAIEGLKSVMSKMASQKVLGRSIHHISDQKRIAECREQLTQALQKFDIAVHCMQVCHQRRVERELEALRLAHVALLRKLNIVHSENNAMQALQISKLHRLDATIGCKADELSEAQRQMSFNIRLQSVTIIAITPFVLVWNARIS